MKGPKKISNNKKNKKRIKDGKLKEKDERKEEGEVQERSKLRKKAVKTNNTDSAEVCMDLKVARYCPSSSR
jgi:hypothetical protein